jgi:hypothetical protein
MNNLFLRWQSKFTAAQLMAISLLALVFNLWATELLNTSYATSGFPVPYWQAQLSFDANKLKGWYQVLLERGTLDLYVQTQHIDFVFIVSVLILHVVVLLAISRALPENSGLRRAMIIAAMLSAIAPIADALENGVSFVMLANPTDFAEGLAWIYSSLAAVKFAMFTFAYLAAILGLVCAAWLFITRRIQARKIGERQRIQA